MALNCSDRVAKAKTIVKFAAVLSTNEAKKN